MFWGGCIYHLNNIFTLQSPPFPFSFHLRSGPQRCDIWTAALLGSHFSSCAVSQTAKLDDLAIQRAENSCMKPSNHLDKPSLKRPGNVTLIQTHSFLFPPPRQRSPPVARRSCLALARLCLPPAHWFGRKGQTNKCFLSFLLIKVMREDQLGTYSVAVMVIE